MAVAYRGPVSTHFDLPRGQETGESELAVVANGIPSAPVTVFVQESDDEYVLTTGRRGAVRGRRDDLSRERAVAPGSRKVSTPMSELPEERPASRN